MRLSEERIEFLSNQIAQTLLNKKLVGYYNRKKKLNNVIAHIMMMDLKMEDKIDEEVVKMIKSIKRDIPEGSSEWVSIFQEKKAEIAKRHNYIY
ncbi:MAG TPA: DUF507 family protein [Candidatus Sumerlaeota bacterium]|nr:MAG: hypothetical protein BWY12_00539 [candidate division BRC1 bacterium ADurb.Bin183]HOE63149.1 DUF507 family protein [Candidatus Sumerlaeota bacterium]HQH10799.1 DUF507 family protein [Candidatus Sumerlaeota bacterium]HRR31623.1 DUF507 family protein [Candidatus Sumerlaeia bacterium]HRR99799.1 DUF507 family protein [Candidatus Sumerlaeia bacterium]